MSCQEFGGAVDAGGGPRVLCAVCQAELRATRLGLRDEVLKNRLKNRALRAKVQEQTERWRRLRLGLSAQLAQMRSGRTAETRSLTVLVVDDEPTVRDSIRLLLEDFAARVLTARDGEEALALAEWRVPDLILTDLRMPRVDGWELVRRLRRSPRTKLAFVIAVSAYVAEHEAERLREAGFDGWLSKPFHPDELLALLATAQRRLIA